MIFEYGMEDGSENLNYPYKGNHRRCVGRSGKKKTVDCYILCVKDFRSRM